MKVKSTPLVAIVDSLEDLSGGLYRRGSVGLGDRLARLFAGDVDLGIFHQLQRTEDGYVLSFSAPTEDFGGTLRLAHGHPTDLITDAVWTDVVLDPASEVIEVVIHGR